MAFVLFPLQLALLRVIVPCLLLLLLPFLVLESEPKAVGFDMGALPEPVGQRVLAFVKSYARNLLRLTVMTLPWMLLAAVVLFERRDIRS